MSEVTCRNRRSYMGSSLTKLKELHGKMVMTKRREYKKETESLIMAPQEQVIRTDALKAKLEKAQYKIKCRLHGKADETVRHMVCECLMLPQREYKRRYEWVGRKIHWEVCRKIGFDVNKK